jgi:hypothetical protein
VWAQQCSALLYMEIRVSHPSCAQTRPEPYVRFGLGSSRGRDPLMAVVSFISLPDRAGAGPEWPALSR